MIAFPLALLPGGKARVSETVCHFYVATFPQYIPFHCGKGAHVGIRALIYDYRWHSLLCLTYSLSYCPYRYDSLIFGHFYKIVDILIQESKKNTRKFLNYRF